MNIFQLTSVQPLIEKIITYLSSVESNLEYIMLHLAQHSFRRIGSRLVVSLTNVENTKYYRVKLLAESAIYALTMCNCAQISVILVIRAKQKKLQGDLETANRVKTKKNGKSKLKFFNA